MILVKTGDGVHDPHLVEKYSPLNTWNFLATLLGGKSKKKSINDIKNIYILYFVVVFKSEDKYFSLP